MRRSVTEGYRTSRSAFPALEAAGARRGDGDDDRVKSGAHRYPDRRDVQPGRVDSGGLPRGEPPAAAGPLTGRPPEHAAPPDPAGAGRHAWIPYAITTGRRRTDHDRAARCCTWPESAMCSATPSTDSAAIPGQHAWAWAWAQFWAHSSTRIGVNRPNLIFAVISLVQAHASGVLSRLWPPLDIPALSGPARCRGRHDG